jgi:hypothetical protein
MSSIYTKQRKLRKQKNGKGFKPLSHNSIIFSSPVRAVRVAKARGIWIPDRDVERVVQALRGGCRCDFIGGCVAPVEKNGKRAYAVVVAAMFGGIA